MQLLSVNFKARLFVFIGLLFLSLIVKAQTLNEFGVVPSVAPETSGLEANTNNQLFTHNDGGNDSAIYVFDTLGTLLRTISIYNYPNLDWEELAQDDSGYIYIGDFGNNNNDRQNLRILKIPNPDDIIPDSIAAQAIFFNYEDQSGFPPPLSQQNFDMEALFHYNDSLWLFSKNRTVPYNGYTKRYVLPDLPGTYTAKLIDSLYTGNSIFESWITSADISQDKSKVVLLSQEKMFLLSNFSGTDFFGGDVQEINFPSNTQKEGICFVDSCTVYITDELVTQNNGGRLYKLNTCEPVGMTEPITKKDAHLYFAWPQPAYSILNIGYYLAESIPQAVFVLCDVNGKVVIERNIDNNAWQVQLNATEIPAGIYFGYITTDNLVSDTLKIVVSH